MIRNKIGLLTINQFAKICRSTTRTVRFYEEKGLLRPYKVDNSTGYRYYLSEQARDFFRIKLLQNFDIPLNNMKKALKKSSDEEFLKGELFKLEREMVEQKKKFDFLSRINTFLHDSESPQKFVSIETVEEFSILAIQKKDLQYITLTKTIQELFQYARNNNIEVYDQVVISYLEPDKYQPSNANLEVGIVIRGVINKKLLSTGYFYRQIPRHKAIVYIYEGPYEYLTFIHQKLFYSEYFKKFEFINFPFDWEVKGYADAESSYEYITKVIYPIK